MEKVLVEKFSPFNAKNLTADELKSMQDFTTEDLQALAEAYPNRGNQSAYLVLMDRSKPENKQVFPLSTWNNLYQLFRLGNKTYVAYSFKSIFNRKAQAVKKVAPVQDMTNQQAKEELKKAGKTQKPEPKKATSKPVLPVADQQTATKSDTSAPKVKNFAKMNIDELTAEFKTAFKKDPPAGVKKKDLVAALEAKKK